MKIALVHDYLNEFGGAERVLEALCQLYPNAPVYTAFYKPDSPAYLRLKHRRIIPSWAHYVPFFASKLHSPLRFLAPLIWQSFDFSGYDVVISSSSWYITKGIKVPSDTLHLSYIHTPPRYLYGYSTSHRFSQPVVKLYAALVNHYLRQFDFQTAQKVTILIANSKEVQSRIRKFWRRDATVIYPPVEIAPLPPETKPGNSRSYLLTGGRLVAPKHFDLAIMAANAQKLPLKIFGTGPETESLKSLAGPTVEFLGKVTESALAKLYAGAQAFIALADDEDFGITPVEAMLAGTPVIAFRGGGYCETVIDGQTGVFIDELTPQAVINGINRLHTLHLTPHPITAHAARFSKSRFQQHIADLVDQHLS